jgi:hypothetical protein
MRRALDWLVVDRGGQAAGVLPFAGAGKVAQDGWPMPEVCARILHALQGGAGREARADDSAFGDGA